MHKSSPGERAIENCELEDVFLISSNCWVARDYNPTGLVPSFTYGQETGVESEVLLQERSTLEGADPMHVLRYFVRAEVRLLKPGVEAPMNPDEKPDSDKLLAELKFLVAADYRCPRDFLEDKEAVGAFARNAHYHCWPYLREQVHSACERMRLPRVTLPMLKPSARHATTTQQEQ